MSAHFECGSVGKFDCSFDEYVYDVTVELGDGEGDVESPVAWFAEVTLVPGDPKEDAAIEHYGTQWLIAREFNDGRFAVETYEHMPHCEERLDSLRAAYAEWDPGVLS